MKIKELYAIKNSAAVSCHQASTPLTHLFNAVLLICTAALLCFNHAALASNDTPPPALPTTKVCGNSFLNVYTSSSTGKKQVYIQPQLEQSDCNINTGRYICNSMAPPPIAAERGKCSKDVKQIATVGHHGTTITVHAKHGAYNYACPNGCTWWWCTLTDSNKPTDCLYDQIPSDADNPYYFCMKDIKTQCGK